MSLELWIAVYGAVVATGTFGWRLYEWRYEKPRLRIDVKTDMVWSEAYGAYIRQTHSQDEKVITYAITNIGKRPTTLQSISVKASRGIGPFKKTEHSYQLKAYQHKNGLPKILHPGETWTEKSVENPDFRKLKEKFSLFVEVSHSFSKNPTMKKLTFLQDQ